MTPQLLTLWAFSLLMLAVAVACIIVVGYVTFKVLCSIKEKGLQAISDWFVGHSWGEKKMFELISYCIIGGCLIWTLGLVLYLCIESVQGMAELEEILRQHARKEW